MAFQLRILSGKHKGAELRLETRRYSLGSGEENSLILSDSNIAKKHISFFFAEGEISVLSADGGLLVDGVSIDKFPIDVAPLQVMTLAVSEPSDNVSIAFRETEASGNLSGDLSGGADANLNASVNASVNANVDNWPDEEKIEELLLKNKQLKDTKNSSQKTRQVEKKLGAFARMGSRMGYSNKKILVPSIIATLATLAAIALLTITTLLWLDPARWQAKRMQKVEKRLEKELASKPQSQRTVRIAQEKDGSFVLLGYVETEKELVRLRGLAFESGLQIRVVSKEQLIAAIEVIAQQYNLYANFKLAPIGKASTIKTKNKENRPTVAGERKRGDTYYSFEDLQLGGGRLITAQEFNERRKRETQHFKLRAEGFVEHERKLEAFRKEILQSLPYISEVEMDVTTNELMLASIRNAISKNIAFSGVHLNLQLGQLVLSGAIFANFHDELQDILQKHYQKLSRAPVPKDRITLAPPLYAKITALLLGRQRAVDIVMRKNAIPKRYLVGQVIDNDKQIIAIASNGIILNYRDKTLGFPISETLANINNPTKTTTNSANSANKPASAIKTGAQKENQATEAGKQKKTNAETNSSENKPLKENSEKKGEAIP